MIALGIIYDLARPKLEPMPRPFVPRPPKFDDRFTRKRGQFCWVSEMTLDDIEWWRGKKAESADGGGQYAESDRKWVAKFDKWLEWRRLFPSEVWSGTRGDDRATAAPPSREPRLYPWGERSNGKGENKNQPETPPEDDGEESNGF
jgi:hypothetical protein